MGAKRVRLQKARRDAAYTQETLAQELHVDRGTVYRWESGKSEPQPYIRPKVAKLLGISLRELGDLLALDEVELSELTNGSSTKIDVGVWHEHKASCLSQEPPSKSAYLESVELNRNLEASSLGAKTLEQLDSAIENFGLDYLHVPPGQTLKDAGDTRRFVIDALSHKHTLTQQKKLYAVAGWLSALIGHSSFDLGESFGVTHGHLSTALHLASETDQQELIAWIRGTQALSAIFRNRPQAAIEFSQSGQTAAHERSAMKVRLLAQEARAHARLGDQKLAERCIADAERSLDNVDEPLTTSILSFDRPYLPYYAGTCYSWLGRTNLAAKCSREAIVLCDRAPDDWPVARILARIDLAEALVQQNELDEAVKLAHDCLDICIYGRRTAPVQGRLRDLLATLGAAMSVSQTSDLADQFHAIFRDGMDSANGS